MATDAQEKPYWLRPPWMILFDVVRLHRVRPWDVNLSFLLNSLLSEMRKKGYIDFTAGGIALLSSANIYRMKSELILKMGMPPPEPQPQVVDFIPPPIQLPFRYEYTSTTISQLIDALDETLKTETYFLVQKTQLESMIPAPPVLQQLDKFMVQIEENIAKVLDRINEMLRESGKIRFTMLTSGSSRIEVIRMFLIILFLVCRGKIGLRQEDESGEIYITAPGDGEDGI